jgi:hypothetical protein
VIDAGPVVILLLGLVDQEMLFLVPLFQRAAAVKHIQADGALGSLDQNVMLRPVEGGTVLQNGIPIIRILHGDKQHVILIPEAFPLVSHIAPCHGHLLRTAAHQKLDAVQLVDVMVQMAP